MALSILSMQRLSILSYLPGLLASAALFILMTMTFADVVLRSVFNAPIEIAADLTRLLMAIMVFAMLPVMSVRGAHISVDLLEGVFEKYKLLRISDIVVNLICGAMLLWPAKRVFDLAERSRSYGDKMEYLGLPLHYLGWFIAVMTAITALALFARGIGLIFAPRYFEEQE